MKKGLKIALGVAGGVPAAITLFAYVTFYVLHPKMRPPPDVKAPSTPEAIARGEYLANHVFVCLGCHSKVDESKSGEPAMPGMLGSGREFPDVKGFPARLRAPNLTPDKETGIGDYTDGQVLRAMREGVARDGRP